MKIDLQTALLLGVIAFFVMRGCDDSQQPPGPDVLSPREAAEQSVEDYRTALATEFTAAADEIAAGRIVSDSDLTGLTERTEAARKQAFRVFDEATEAAIPNGKWDAVAAKQAEQFCREAAAGFRG